MNRLKGMPLACVCALIVMLTLVCAGCASKSSGTNRSIPTENVNDTNAKGATPQEGVTSTPPPDVPSSSYVVVIDAGHQTNGNSSQEPIGPGASETKPKVSSGTSGSYSGVPEYQVNLQVALKLRDYLKDKGVNVIMVRETNDVDISNSQRAAVANDNNANLFVRLHCDGVDSSASNGFSTLVPGSNSWTAPIVAESAKAGRIVQASAVAATGAKDLGVKERTDLSGFNWCKVPTVLCEMGFMTNQEEDAKLTSDSYQQLLAQGIGDGVYQYLTTS
jgi:N-acetylmuramoyl-L-alanine amidase